MNEIYDNLFTNVYNILKRDFRIGDRVIVVHSNCKLYHGRLTGLNKYEITVGSKTYKWSDIVLIAHDGFPCKEFHMSLSLEQFDKVENWESMLALYKHMDIPLEGLDENLSFREQANNLKKIMFNERKKQILEEKLKKEKEEYERMHPITHIGYGCPFEITDVQAMLLNPFNGLALEYEETLYMKSIDEATGMLWNLEGEILEVNI